MTISIFVVKVEKIEEKIGVLQQSIVSENSKKQKINGEIALIQGEIAEKQVANKGTKTLENKVVAKQKALVKADAKIAKINGEIQKHRNDQEMWKRYVIMFDDILDIGASEFTIPSALRQEDALRIKDIILPEEALAELAEKLYIQRSVVDVLSNGNNEISAYFRELIRNNPTCIYKKDGWYRGIVVGKFLLFNQINPTYVRDYDTLYDLLSKKDFLSIMDMRHDAFVKALQEGAIKDKQGNIIDVDEVVEIVRNAKAELVQIRHLTSEILQNILVFNTTFIGKSVDYLVELGMEPNLVGFIKNAGMELIDELLFKDKNDLIKLRYIGEKRADTILEFITMELK